MKRFLFMLTLLVAIPAQASFAPKNNLKIYPDQDEHVDAINHANFDKAIDMVLNHWGPIYKAKGYTLVFNRKWSDPTVNSDTYREGDTIYVNSYGGLARYPGMNTVAAYSAVACHEVGHSAGGAPRFSDGSGMSVEGQADRWAYRTCMKSIGWPATTMRAAAEMLADVLAKLGSEPVPRVPGPQLPAFRGIEEDHPPAQCRLDEYLGAMDGKPRNPCWYNP